MKERSSVLRYEPTWKFKMVINGFGAVATFAVMIMFAATKFMDGAWVIILIIPLLVTLFSVIQRHYINVAKKLSMDNYGSPPPRVTRNRVLVPIGGVHRGTLAALRYARALSDDITAIHIAVDPDEAERVRQKWELWGDGVRLMIVESSYRRFMEPLLLYIDEIYQRKQPNEVITIVVPMFVSHKRATEILHTNTADALREALMFRKGIVITNVPYLID